MPSTQVMKKLQSHLLTGGLDLCLHLNLVLCCTWKRMKMI